MSKNIWIRVGDNGTQKPFIVSDKIIMSKKDPVIKECLSLYISEMKKNNIKIEEPIKVAITHGNNLAIIKELNYTLKELNILSEE